MGTYDSISKLMYRTMQQANSLWNWRAEKLLICTGNRSTLGEAGL